VKIVFMGSPQFAVSSLDALIEARFDVRLVVTQPDRRAGRGRRLERTAVKQAAQAHGLPVIDFEKGDSARVTRAVLEEKPDAIVVAAFGHILRKPLLTSPSLGCLNVHASLLPRWRGVSPVQFAVLHGDAWTGVTIMQMDAGVDTGPILAQRAVAIAPDETAGDLCERLQGLGADLLVHTLRALAAGRISPVPQGDLGAVYAPKLTKSLAPIRWERPVTVIHNQIRALQPNPGANSFLDSGLLKITKAQPHSFRTATKEPGTILSVSGEGIQVACGEGILLISSVQSPGRKELPVAQFIRGHEIQVGQIFRS
jgi:methionyl-tRNA formyltransferase